jgi:hypothetical protein
VCVGRSTANKAGLGGTMGGKWNEPNRAVLSERKAARHGTVPGSNTDAFDKVTPRPLLWKEPLSPTPLAWFRRNPGCAPFTASKVSIMRAPVSACGVSQPPASSHGREQARVPERQRSLKPIAARRTPPSASPIGGRCAPSALD